MRVACQITLTDDERETLRRWSRGRRTPARLVTRAKIVLLAAEGMQNKDIAAEVGTDRLSVSRWRRRIRSAWNAKCGRTAVVMSSRKCAWGRSRERAVTHAVRRTDSGALAAGELWKKPISVQQKMS